MNTDLMAEMVDLVERKLPPEERLARAQKYLKNAQAAGREGAQKYWQRVIDNTQKGRPLPARTSDVVGEPDPDGHDDRPAQDAAPRKKGGEDKPGEDKDGKKLPDSADKLVHDPEHRKTVGQKVGGLLGSVVSGAASLAIDTSLGAVKKIPGAAAAVGQWASGVKLGRETRELLRKAAGVAAMSVLGAAAFGGAGLLAGMAITAYFASRANNAPGGARSRDDDARAKAATKPGTKPGATPVQKQGGTPKGDAAKKDASKKDGASKPGAKPADDKRAGTGPKKDAPPMPGEADPKDDPELDADLKRLKQKVKAQDAAKKKKSAPKKDAAKDDDGPEVTLGPKVKLNTANSKAVLADIAKRKRASKERRKAKQAAAKKESLVAHLRALLVEAEAQIDAEEGTGDADDAAMRKWLRAVMQSVKDGFEGLGEMDPEELEAILQTAYEHPETALGD